MYSTSREDLNDKEGKPTPPPKTGLVQAVNLILYVLVTILSMFMVFWILVFPSSLLYEHSTIHQNLLRSMFSLQYSDVGAVSSDIITKYRGQYLVQITHILPGAIWAALIPFQLNTQFRKQYRTLHQYVGCMFVSVSLVLGTGVFIILRKGLLYENFFHDLAPVQYTSSPGLMALSIYFMGTILMAFSYATITRNYYKHSIWITRHIASGIWIALQRILLGSPLFNRPPMSREQQRSVFGQAVIVAVLITFICCEMIISLWNYERIAIATAKANNKVE
jgi:hypothetical protein